MSLRSRLTTPATTLPNQYRLAALFDLATVRGAVLAVLLLRLLFGVLALVVSVAFPDTAFERQVGIVPGTAPLDQWLERVFVAPWLRYDAWNYQRIVEHGYRVDEGTSAFHPLYPLLATPLAWLLGGNELLALLLVSTAATAGLCIVFSRYVARFHGVELSQRAGWLLLFCPPAFILLAPYNEALFMALAVGSLWAMRERRWLWAGLLGALATLTRQQGLALALPLAYALFQEVSLQLAARGSPAFRLSSFVFRLSSFVFYLALVPLGYALFVAYRGFALNDLAALSQADSPTGFLRALLVSQASEQVVVGQRITWPWVGIADQLRLIATTPASYDLVIDLVLGSAGIAVIGLGLRQMHSSERLYSLALVGLSLCYYNGSLNPLLSLPRHILIAFPLFIVLARWLGSGSRARLALEALLMLNLFLVGAFIRHGWVP